MGQHVESGTKEALRLSRAVSGPGEATRVAGNGVRGVELSDVALETVAGPTSALKSTAVASSAAASVASQSPGWANTSNLAPVLVFFVVEETGDKRWSEMQSEHRSNRTHQPVVHPGRRRVMWSARWLVGSRQNCDAAACRSLRFQKNQKMHLKQCSETLYVIFE